MFGADQYVVYTVKSGDTLDKIGKLFGVPYQEIAKANMITDVNKIEVGAELMIPEIYTPANVPAVIAQPKTSSSGVTKIQPTKGGQMAETKPDFITSLMTGTLCGIPKIYAYTGIAAVTALLAAWILSSKKSSTGTLVTANPRRKTKSRKRRK